MRTLAATFILLSLTFAQDSAPAGARVEWNATAPGAIKELPDGRTQRTVNTDSAAVSVIADVVPARRFVDPPADGGNDVTYVVIGIRNSSQQTINIQPDAITLRAVGKKEKDFKPLTVEKVIGRAWQGNERVAGAVPISAGSMAGGDGNASVDMAVTHQQLDTSNRRLQEASERQTVAQAARLKDKALLPRELAPGESVMGMLFFYPYEKKDNLELTVPVGGTTFVIPFSGKSKR